MQRIKRGILHLMPALIILISLLLISYPFLSEMLYVNRADSLIRTHEAGSSQLEQQKISRMLSLAQAYNQKLQESGVKLSDPFCEDRSEALLEDYDQLLRSDESGLMGSIEIPAIDVDLPIYHGTAPEDLEHGVGHLKKSSLPVGGEGTHCVLTGHTGLNKAKLFTDLANMQKGDLVFIHVLDQTLAYKVQEMETVLPDNTDSLGIRKDQDLLTLVTCTPYGINSHRLLVHCVRTEFSQPDYDQVILEGSRPDSSQWMASYKSAIGIGLVIVTVIISAVGLWDRRELEKNRKGRRESRIAGRKPAEGKKADGKKVQS